MYAKSPKKSIPPTTALTLIYVAIFIIKPGKMVSEKLKVLIVDDSVIIGTRIKSMLNEIDGVIIIGQARNGREAIGHIEYFKPHVVLLDIQMGNDNGVDLLVKFKRDYPDILVIMLSNFSYPYYRKLCKEKGADYFFDKSTEFDGILDLLNQIVAV